MLDAYFKIPGAMFLATTSYAIYLTHKPIIHITQILLNHWHLGNSDIIMLSLTVLFSGIGGGLLYICVEKPFLKFRDKIGSINSANQVNTRNQEAVQLPQSF